MSNTRKMAAVNELCVLMIRLHFLTSLNGDVLSESSSRRSFLCNQIRQGIEILDSPKNIPPLANYSQQEGCEGVQHMCLKTKWVLFA